MAMGNNGKTFKTVVFEDGTHAVVRTDPRKPHLLEVIAIFYDASRARFYADRENSGSAEELSKITPQAAPKKDTVAPTGVEELSSRQRAVLEALRAKMDANGQVAEKAATLVEAARIPLGSLHSVLQSLEKKQLIKTARAGSARVPAVYQVL